MQKKEELKLIEYDQMNYEIKNYNLKCAGFKEGKINFLPTYKYSDDDSNILVCDSKDHIPSWTDRILYYINDNKFHLIEEEINNDKYKDKDSIDYDSEKEEEDKNNDNINKENIEPSVQLIYYNSMQDMLFSDHKPVFAYFNINIS